MQAGRVRKKRREKFNFMALKIWHVLQNMDKEWRFIEI